MTSDPSSSRISSAIFRKAGFLTMVQGIPFRGYRHKGMPLAGAADPVALALANWLVGNTAEASGYETTMMPVELEAFTDCCLAVHGAATRVLIDGEERDTSAAIFLTSGQTLTIPPPDGGCRSYIAFRGGVPGEKRMGARSTYLPAAFGGNGGKLIADGYTPKAVSLNNDPWEERILPLEYRLPHGDEFILRVTDAQESTLLDNAEDLFTRPYTISRRADRIGIELDGTQITLKPHPPMESSAVFPGTIQCPPSGKPFLLGPDAQTTGGYPRIAQVIRADRHLIGQLRPGARMRLQRINPVEARRLYRSKIALLRKLQPALRLD
ncbi:MAG: biotin-dependent carboxyltransferase family protein [Sphingorhabdus sp.]